MTAQAGWTNTGHVRLERRAGGLGQRGVLVPRPFVSPLGSVSFGSSGDMVRRSSVVTRAIFGVGAPEAILVGVVALVLFGPKGLAQAAKSFGQVVKSVAPTLRELTDISTDLKSTIEDEIGLSEIRDELENTLSPLQRATTSRSRDTGKSAFEEDPDIEAKRAASMKAAWGASEGGGQADEGATAGATEGVGRAARPASSGMSSAVDGLSTEELEKIIAARKAAEDEGL